ncbi:hypothetical protein YC2023_087927 [Brassica napus]
MFGCDIADFQTYDSDKVHIDNIDEIEEIIEAKKDCTPSESEDSTVAKLVKEVTLIQSQFLSFQALPMRRDITNVFRLDKILIEYGIELETCPICYDYTQPREILQLQLPRRLSDLTTGEMKERRHPRFCQIFPANQIIMKPRPKPQLLALVFSLCVTILPATSMNINGIKKQNERVGLGRQCSCSYVLF